MNTRHVHQEYPVHSIVYHALGRQQARRRQLLGILLILVGSGWACLRLAGLIGDLPSPIGWVVGSIFLLDSFNISQVGLIVGLAACGILATYTVRPRR